MATLEEVREKLAQRELGYWFLFGKDDICLDGDFSLEDLEYIVTCIRELEV